MLVILKWAGYLGKFPGVGSFPPKRGGPIRTELTEEIKQPAMEGPNLTEDLPTQNSFSEQGRRQECKGLHRTDDIGSGQPGDR